MKATASTVLVLASVWASPSQAQSTPIIVDGTFEPQSGVRIDDGETSGFGCDTAAVARTDRGTVLIQFTDKAGDDGRILGFAGTIKGNQGFGADAAQMVAVERICLPGGATPIPATRDTCIMNWSGLQRTGRGLTSVLCAAASQAEESQQSYGSPAGTLNHDRAGRTGFQARVRHILGNEVPGKYAGDLGIESLIPLRPRRQAHQIPSLRHKLTIGRWGDRQVSADRFNPIGCAMVVD